MSSYRSSDPETGCGLMLVAVVIIAIAVLVAGAYILGVGSFRL